MTGSAARSYVRPVSAPGTSPDVTVRLDPTNIWRVGFVVIALAAVALFLRFVIGDAGSVIFTLLMAWFASIATEPAVGRLARRMPRGAATGLVLLGVVVFVIVFGLAFGQLFVQQIAQLLEGLPALVDSVIGFVNERTGSSYDAATILDSLNITSSQVASYAATVVGGILGLLGSVVGGLFSMFTFALFTFYFSADGPRLRRYTASLFPPRIQPVAVTVWDVTAQKTGGYVAARLVLALINGASSAVVFLLIGMPSWLALGIWTGVVAQFVPTIGTYIAIALPVLVGLLSDNPWIGVIALAWALLYQQVENLTIEPRISAKAVDVHPAFAFAAVMLGTALFGVAGALLAIPVGAMIITLGGIYRKRYDLRPDLDDPAHPDDGREAPPDLGDAEAARPVTASEAPA